MCMYCVCVSECVRVHAYLCVCVCVCVCLCVCVCVLCMSLFMCMCNAFVHMYLYGWAHACIHMYICECMYSRPFIYFYCDFTFPVGRSSCKGIKSWWIQLYETGFVFLACLFCFSVKLRNGVVYTVHFLCIWGEIIACCYFVSWIIPTDYCVTELHVQWNLSNPTLNGTWSMSE